MPRSKRSKAKRTETKSGHWYRLVWMIGVDMNRDLCGLMMSLTILGAKLKEQRTHGLQCLIGARMLRPYAMEEEGTLSRTPLVDMVDRGDRYNLRLEVPGIDKDKIQLNATEDSIEISGEQSEEESTEDKGHNYIYNERSYRSFYRSIPIPEEILPSKITARMNNGILQIEIPKKDPSRPSGGSTRIEIR